MPRNLLSHFKALPPIAPIVVKMEERGMRIKKLAELESFIEDNLPPSRQKLMGVNVDDRRQKMYLRDVTSGRKVAIGINKDNTYNYYINRKNKVYGLSREEIEDLIYAFGENAFDNFCNKRVRQQNIGTGMRLAALFSAISAAAFIFLDMEDDVVTKVKFREANDPAVTSTNVPERHPVPKGFRDPGSSNVGRYPDDGPDSDDATGPARDENVPPGTTLE